ncbi:hypothetical protein SAMN05444169_0482 [Bradyrhizobium erythrophlei]|uniref:Uncharacterized protein n=1 Tax=Bradyrhizobium erythrophlei TaxID=1437360 RepID=A0A1M5H0B1_9BRAD|nr:hypothetical protein SAMN05444169_0482 [Bradyrhizobium erythrophlei]
MDAKRARDERARCGRRSRVVLTPRRWRQVSQVQICGATVARKPGHRGEREVSRKPSRRESRMFPVEPVVLPPCFFCTGPTGAIGTRLSLRPLFTRWAKTDTKLGRIAPRERGGMSAGCLTIESEVHAVESEGLTPVMACDKREAFAQGERQRRSNPLLQRAEKWIASRSLSSGAHTRDPLARNDADGDAGSVTSATRCRPYIRSCG